MKILTINSHSPSVLSLQGVGAIDPMGSRSLQVDDAKIDDINKELAPYRVKNQIDYTIADAEPAPAVAAYDTEQAKIDTKARNGYPTEAPAMAAAPAKEPTPVVEPEPEKPAKKYETSKFSNTPSTKKMDDPDSHHSSRKASHK